MSFDINPSRNLSNVQASHKSTDGGAGNTGYFQRGEYEEINLGFAKDYPNDSFSKEDVESEDSAAVSAVFGSSTPKGIYAIDMKLFNFLTRTVILKRIF